MTPLRVLLAFCSITVVALTADVLLPSEPVAAMLPVENIPSVVPQDADKLVYADFETTRDERPVSNRGGLVQLFAYQERPTFPSKFKGLEGSNPPAPETVRLSKDDPNKAIAFEYELQGSNQWAGVTLEVQGQSNQEGKLGADDVSGYKYLTLQIYVTGVSSMRIEFISTGHGVDVGNGNHQMTFRVSPGFNTYKVPIQQLAQPSWAETRIKAKEVLKKLTAIRLIAFCDQCSPVKGTVVVDNIIFQS